MSKRNKKRSTKRTPTKTAQSPQKPDTNSFGVRVNRWLYWAAGRWLTISLITIGIFATLPFAAPTFMHLGWERAGNAVYLMYKPFCHQFGFRSFFLYGEQSVYPRANTGTDLMSFEEAIEQTQPPEFEGISNLYADKAQRIDPETGETVLDIYDWGNLQLAARAFVGNETMGYKVTVCERDMSIYLALWVGGLLYAVFRQRIRPVPLWLWFWLGLGPIGIDGFSQLLSYPPLSFWPIRETLPMFRVLTGATFGFMNAWLGFPYLELSFEDTRLEIEEKFRRAGIPLNRNV